MKKITSGTKKIKTNLKLFVEIVPISKYCIANSRIIILNEINRERGKNLVYACVCNRETERKI